jgi:triosephosphate isomerase
VLIAANWKMYKTRAETRAFLDAFSPPSGVNVVIAPPYTSLAAAVEGGVSVYAQNVHWEEEGAFTGEISASMLRELGVTGAIVGHSERRQYFGETDETVARRASSALAAGLALGYTPLEAARRAREVAAAAVAAGLHGIGAGSGPVDALGLAGRSRPAAAAAPGGGRA